MPSSKFFCYLRRKGIGKVWGLGSWYSRDVLDRNYGGRLVGPNRFNQRLKVLLELERVDVIAWLDPQAWHQNNGAISALAVLSPQPFTEA